LNEPTANHSEQSNVIDNPPSAPSALPGFREEFPKVWAQIPLKALFGVLLAAWLALFHFLGNSTLGYVDTTSLFRWMIYAYENNADDQLGYVMPFVVLVLLWWKRKDILDAPKRIWWPALGLVVIGLLFHFLGFLVQQTRVSIVGFFVGLYGLTGLVWGPRWLRTTFFPFFLLAFCVPLGNTAEKITFPMRILATKISMVLSHGLGVQVVRQGTSIWEPTGKFQYEVAAACGGIRSLTAFLAFSMIYSFVFITGFWRRLLVIAAAFPLAVLSNVIRLMTIIITAEAINQQAGNWVHENFVFSLLPYLPSLVGLLALGYFLQPKPRKEAA